MLDDEDYEDGPKTPSEKFYKPTGAGVPEPGVPAIKKPRGPFRRIVLYEKHRAASGKAILFSTHDAGDESGEDIWLPTSQINHMTHEPALEGGYRRTTIEATEWILNQKGL